MREGPDLHETDPRGIAILQTLAPDAGAWRAAARPRTPPRPSNGSGWPPPATSRRRCRSWPPPSGRSGGSRSTPPSAPRAQLAEQIRQGAPFDVFLSANREFVAKLAGPDGSIDPGRTRSNPYARGALVLAVNTIFDPKVKTPGRPRRPEVKAIAIANPETAPYGMAAKQALERAGLWEALKPKIVPAESVRQALQFVQSGNADVAFVGRSIAGRPGRSRRSRCRPTPATRSIQSSASSPTTGPGPTKPGRSPTSWLGDVGQGIFRDLGIRPGPGRSKARRPRDDSARPRARSGSRSGWRPWPRRRSSPSGCRRPGSWPVLRFPGKGLSRRPARPAPGPAADGPGLRLAPDPGPARAGRATGWMASFGVSVVFHWSGAVIASAVAAFPLFLIPARSAFEGVDPALEDAARLLGRARPSVFAPGHAPARLARAGRRRGPGLRPGPGRLRRDDDGRRRHPRPDPDRLLAIYDAAMADDPARAGRLSRSLVALASRSSRS